MSRSQKMLTYLAALLMGLVTGGVCTHAAYWMDGCLGKESGGYGVSPDVVNRCRK